MNLLYNNSILELKIGGRGIYLCTNTWYAPDVIYGDSNFSVKKARIGYFGKNGEGITEMVDVWDLKRQLDNASLSDDQGMGNYCYADREFEYCYVIRKNNKVRFNPFEDHPTPEYTELNDGPCDVKHIGMNPEGLLEYVIISKAGDVEVRLFINRESLLDSYIA